jgi:site-specific DNA-methyltransferase (adenine-specific)
MPTGDETESKTTENTEVKDDDFDPDAKYETKVKAGEVWQLGDHRLMCGDSTKAEDVAKLMNGEQADLWLTDPPYNVAYEGGTADKLTIKNDSMKDDAFNKFLVDAFTAARDVLKEGSSFYIWYADVETFNFSSALRTVGLQLRQVLIWAKNGMILGRKDYHFKHEPCLYGWKDGAAHNWYADRKQTTVMEFDKPLHSTEHPTMKPVPLFAYQMENSSKEGDIVLDTFGGSGTTIIAAESLKRKARLMELDPHYCNVIIARWEKLTGGKAQKIEGV